MLSVEDSRSRCNADVAPRFPRHCFYFTPPPSTGKVCRSFGGRSMRTIRSSMFQAERCHPIPENSVTQPENVADSVTEGELADKAASSANAVASLETGDTVGISCPTSDFSACSSDISRELQRLSAVPDPGLSQSPNSDSEPEHHSEFLQRETFSTDIIESISAEDLQPVVKICIDGLQSSSIAAKRSAAAKLRVLAKNRADNRALIGESGAVPNLIPLLRCSDPTTQEHAVTALLNLSLHESNKIFIINSGAVKSLIHVLETGTETSKQNAACGLLSLASTDNNKLSIGASGAVLPLVKLLRNGSNNGKKDALTTLYKLCSVKKNKERAVTAGAVRPLLGLVGEMEKDTGLAEKAMVVLSSLSGIEMGKEAIVEEGGMSALVEAVENGSEKLKGFAVMTLKQLCGESAANRGLLVKEGAIPPLVSLSQTGTGKARKRAETLLEYTRQSRMEMEEASPSSP